MALSRRIPLFISAPRAASAAAPAREGCIETPGRAQRAARPAPVVVYQNNSDRYEIGIPSSGRLALKMNSINDIVTVHRDMEYAFKRHSQEQTIAILGTVLAVAQVLTVFPVFTSSWKGVAAAIAVCVIAIALMLYFALSEERVKVK